MDKDISTVISGFGQLSNYEAEELRRLILSRDAHIFAVQEACRALHANQKVLTGILQTKGGVITPPYLPITQLDPQSYSEDSRRPIKARGAPLGPAASRTTTNSPSPAASIPLFFPLPLAGSQPPQDERPVSRSKQSLCLSNLSRAEKSKLAPAVSNSRPGKYFPPLMVEMVPEVQACLNPANHRR